MNDGLRIGDAERDQASAALGEHLAQGRLSLEEHAERLDAAWAARTRGDLVPLFADLPGPHQPDPHPAVRRPRRGPRRGSRRGPRRVAAGVLGLLVVLTVLTHLPLVLLAGLVWWVAARHRQETRPPAPPWTHELHVSRRTAA